MRASVAELARAARSAVSRLAVRSRTPLIAAGALLAMATVSVVVLAYLALSQRGVVYGLDALTEIRFADVPGIGANTFLHREPDPAKVRRELEVLRGSGIGMIRQEFQWAEIEPDAKGRFRDAAGVDTWAKFDRIVDFAAELGIEVLVRLDRPPAWATKQPRLAVRLGEDDRSLGGDTPNRNALGVRSGDGCPLERPSGARIDRAVRSFEPRAVRAAWLPPAMPGRNGWESHRIDSSIPSAWSGPTSSTLLRCCPQQRREHHATRDTR